MLKLRKKNLAVSTIFFCGFGKSGMYLSGRTLWEELSKKKRFFLQHVWTENEKSSASWIKFLAKMSKFRFTCPQEQFEETVVRNLRNFPFFCPMSKTFVLNKTRERQKCTEEAFSTFLKVCGFEKQNPEQASRSSFRSLVSHSSKSFCLWDLLSVHASVCQRLHLRPLNINWWRVKR